jgi:hypothetical protein
MRSIRFLLVLTILLASAGTMFGQAGATGTILGTVTDASGAVLPNVKVTVTNTATNVVFHATTSSAGDYNAPSLNPGSYSVSAEAPGFQKTKTASFVLTVDQKVRIDLALKPGAVTDTVEITAQAVELDTDSASLSQEMSGEQVAALPLNGRNFMQLLLVGAGAVTVGGEQGTMRQGVGNAVSINGGRPEGNNYTLDGLVNTDQSLVTPAVVLSQDAIGEFKVQSGIYPAENGFSASQINLVSKAGTNQIHGVLFYDNRNDAYDAKPFVTTGGFYQTGVPTSLGVLRQNQFGYVADGPVVIPKLYNGRDKTFFMANYEGWRINNGYVAQWALPNPEVLTGDFSHETYQAFSLTTNGTTVNYPGGPLPAYGTADCRVFLGQGRNCAPVDPTTGQLYGSNKVPINSRLAQVAIQYGYWATPNLATHADEGVQNFQAKIAQPLTSNQQTYRVDQNLGRFGSVFGRYTYAKYQNSAQSQSTINYGLLTQYETQKNWAISHTISLGNSMVNNFRFGYLDAQAPQGAPAPPAEAISALAETGVFTTFSALQQTWPSIGLSQYNTTGGPGNAYTGSDSPAWEYADSFTMVKGRHTIGIGFDYRSWHLKRNLDDDFYGDWGFSSSTILNNSQLHKSDADPTPSCPNAPVTVGGVTQSLCGTGHAVADMLLGYFSGASGYVPGPLSPKDTAGNPQDHVFSYFAPYVQDDIKVSPKLKLSVGLRWDYKAAAYEAKNHFFWLDTQNANGGLCYADPALTTNGVAPGGDENSGPILRYCGKVPHPGAKTPFAPRLGFNYQLTPKTVARGGYGVFFDSAEGREIDDSGDIYPYAVRNNLNPTGDASLDKFSNNMFPDYSQTLGPLPASTLSFIAVIESENPLNPYVQSWTLSVERELARNTTLEVNYIGTKGTHFLDRRNIAQALPLAGADLAFCQHIDSNTKQYDHLNEPPCTTQSRRPYKNFTSYYINSDWHGYSNYNAMNIKFEHRTHDLAATAIFTWAKSMDDKSAAAGVGATGSGYQGFMNNQNPALDYGPSDFDVDKRFVASYVYQLPFGHGKKFANQINRAEELAIGGWSLSGITTWQTGFPYTFTASDLQGLNTTNFQRANIVPGCNLHAGLTKRFQYVNPDCFTQPDLGVYGNSSRNFLRQPGINNWDMELGKAFNITERVNFKLNIGTFNTFNHAQYAGDVGGLATSGSGGNNSIDSGVGDTYSGYITGANSARIIQFAGKLSF